MTKEQTLPKTHRALIQKVYAELLVVEDVPIPGISSGSAILRVESAGIISYQKDVYNGTRRYPYPTPFVPGLFAIVRVVIAGRLCKPQSNGGLGYSFDQLAWIGMPLVGYGGLRRVKVQAGETVIIAPPTGGFGGAAAMAALAMGARVIAMGRNEKMLPHLENVPPRVMTVSMTGDHDSLVKELTKHGRPDAYLDLSPPAALSSSHLKSAIMSLRKGGRVSLMGGLMSDMKFPTGEIVFNDIELKGQWMYSATVVRDMIKLVESGVLDLSQVHVARRYQLEQWEQAFDGAANMRFDDITVLSRW